MKRAAGMNDAAAESRSGGRKTCSRCGAPYDGVSVHGPNHCEKRAQAAPEPLGASYLPDDITTLETAAESLSRLGDIPNAIALWAIILRLRGEGSDGVT